MAEHGDRLRELLLREEAGTLTDAERDELTTLLLGDDRAFATYIDDLHLRAGLSWLCSGVAQSSDHEDRELLAGDGRADTADDESVWDEVVEQALAARRQHEIEDQANRQLAAQQAEEARLNRYRLRRPAVEPEHRAVVIPKPLVWLGVAAVLGIAAVIIIQLNPASTVPTPTPPIVEDRPGRVPDARPRPAPVVATLVRELDAAWEDNHAAWDGGLGLRRGPHRLVTGLAEIELIDGTRVVLEAPASFELTGTNALTLYDGRLVADVPPSGVGFTVDTPTSRVIDYGTEFGVHADGSGLTRVQVYQGEVRAAARLEGVVVGESVPLFIEEAATIRAGSGRVVQVAFDEAAFERRVAKRLDLVDIVAGGDGSGQARMRAIHPVTGEPTSTPIFGQGRAHFPSARRYQPVPANPFIDGVFVPHHTAAIQVDSAGHTVSGLEVSDPRSYQLIWAGGVLPGDEQSEIREQVGLLYPELPPEQAPVLYMISNKGITIDLDAVRREVDGQAALRLEMGVSNLSKNHRLTQPTGPFSDVHCYLDGELVEQRLDLTPEDGLIEFAFDIPERARFLTLVVVDSGDLLGRDWVVFHRPTIEAEVEGAGRRAR